MLTLKADNLSLVNGAKYTFMANTYDVGTTTFAVANVDGFAVNNFILLGQMGNESTELLQIASINTSAQTITTSVASAFPHYADTRVTVMQFNQIRYFYNTVDTFSFLTPLTGYLPIQVDDFYSRYFDASYVTGFGYFVFYNSFTNDISPPSNPIPYTDFALNSVKKIIDNFFSQLNSKEFSLVTPDDAFLYLNEAYAIATNELNLVNQEYSVPSVITINLTSTAPEVQMPADFGNLVAVNDAFSGNEIPYIGLRQQLSMSSTTTFTNYPYVQPMMIPYYYLRNKFIGIAPLPTSTATWQIYYTAITGQLVSLYDTVNFPNNNFYFLVDYMLFRAARKLFRTPAQAQSDKQNFLDGVNRMKITSIKQNNDRGTFGILVSADN